MSTAQELKALGNAAFQSKDFDAAVEYFTKAIEAEPSDHVLYSNRSGAYASLKKFGPALEDAEKCIAIAPDWAKGYSRQGLALSNLGRIADALEAYQKGLSKDPTNSALRSGFEQVLMQMAYMSPGMNRSAEETAPPETAHPEPAPPKQTEPVKAAAPRIDDLPSFEAQVALAFAHDPKFRNYMNEDKDYVSKVAGIARDVALKRDVQELQLALGIAPDDRIREGLAKLFGIEGDADTSKASPVPVLDAPETPVPTGDVEAERKYWADKMNAEGSATYKKRQFEAAISFYQQAQKLNPDEISYYNNEAAAYLEQGNFDACLAACDKALELRSKADFAKVAKVYNRMAACYRKMDNLPMCIEMYKKSLMEDNDRKIRTALREVERTLEERARQAYIDPVKAEEHKEKGNTHFKNKDYPAAKLEYDEAIKRNPSDAKLFSNRCAVYLQLLEYPSALRDAEKATELDPEFAKAWSRKGTCHYKLKEFHKAISAYQRGLQVDPDNAECQRGLRETLMAVQMTQSSQNVDEEQVNRALSDPEIQHILRDPQFQLILQQLQQDPSRLKDFVGDAKIMDGVQKLIAAGVLRTA